MLTLRSADIKECAALSGLCMRSKAVWGYDDSFMEACRQDLVIAPDNLDRIQVAEIDGQIVGVVEVCVTDNIAQLEKLFVDPRAMRNRVGQTLFDWAKRTAVAGGATMLTIESDPQAADFYRCMGALDDGNVASTASAGRFIPRLKLPL